MLQRTGDIRVMDESGEDYLYPADRFVFIELPRALEKIVAGRLIQPRRPISAWSRIHGKRLLFVVAWASQLWRGVT